MANPKVWCKDSCCFKNDIYINIQLKKSKPELLMQENSDSSFIPDQNEEKIKILDPKLLNKKRKERLKAKDVSTKYAGLWSNEQNQIYIKFLSQNKDDFQDQYLRRSKKVFNRLSQLLANRTSEQCRSHHQKLQLRSNSEKPDDIIEYVSSRILKKKKRGVIKTRPDQLTQIQEKGFTIVQGAYKQIKIILNQLVLQKW